DLIRIGNSSIIQIGGYSGWTDLSDRTVKYDIREDVPGLTFITALRPVSYRIDYHKVAELTGEDVFYLKDGTREVRHAPAFLLEGRQRKSQIRQTGLIAQEVEQLVDRQAVDFNAVYHPQEEGDLYGLKYAEFTVPLIKAVQELSAMVAKLQTQMAVQAEMIAQQQAELQRLTKRSSQVATNR
ncbi:MAG: tail fiber domain-containing protein, partial [Saprospiraceae bacterium]|nr:tail fiber domain-containing protein [Saprospiraceae bacterium]